MSATTSDMTMSGGLPDPKGDAVKIDERQVPAVQVLRRDRQRAGVWVSEEYPYVKRKCQLRKSE